MKRGITADEITAMGTTSLLSNLHSVKTPFDQPTGKIES
jgi:hypothetical protein